MYRHFAIMYCKGIHVLLHCVICGTHCSYAINKLGNDIISLDIWVLRSSGVMVLETDTVVDQK